MKRRFASATGLASLFLIIGLGGGYWFAQHHRPAPPANSVGSTPANSTPESTERKVLYWHDPMVPGRKFEKPGKSPFMDMDLVPVYADEAEAQGKVSISSRTAQSLGVRTVEAKKISLEMAFSAVGAISIDERSITTVQSRVSGYIEKLYVRAQYDPVRRGQRLADIYAPDWLAAEEEFLALKKSWQPGAEMLADAARARLRLLGVSEEQILALERDGKVSPTVTLFAPDSGVVWELGVRDGAAVIPGMSLFKLANLRTVWVNAEVPEMQAELVKPGAAVEARVAAVGGRVFRGKVAALLPDVNATTRTIKARVVLANPQGELAPGMFATLNFVSQQTAAVAVPAEAVISTGERSLVILVDAEGKFSPLPVTTGRTSGDMTEIRTGLTAGQRVVVSGQFLIDSEASLRGALSRMNEPEAPAQVVPSAQGRPK